MFVPRWECMSHDCSLNYITAQSNFWNYLTASSVKISAHFILQRLEFYHLEVDDDWVRDDWELSHNLHLYWINFHLKNKGISLFFHYSYFPKYWSMNCCCCAVLLLFRKPVMLTKVTSFKTESHCFHKHLKAATASLPFRKITLSHITVAKGIIKSQQNNTADVFQPWIADIRTNIKYITWPSQQHWTVLARVSKMATGHYVDVQFVQMTALIFCTVWCQSSVQFYITPCKLFSSCGGKARCFVQLGNQQLPTQQHPFTHHGAVRHSLCQTQKVTVNLGLCECVCVQLIGSVTFSLA